MARFAVPNALPSTGYVEPTSAKRPDLLIFCGAVAFSTDVSVVHLSAQSNVTREIRDFGSSLSARAKRKCERYAAAASTQGHAFLPFVVSSRGVFHKDAVSLLQRVAKAAVWPGTPPAPYRTVAEFFVKSAMFAVTQALYETNARIVANLLAHGAQVATPFRQVVPTPGSQEVRVDQHDDEERIVDL